MSATCPIIEAGSFLGSRHQEWLQTLDQGRATGKELPSEMDVGGWDVWSARKDGRVLMTVPRVGIPRSILLTQYYHYRGQLSVYPRLLAVAVLSIYGPSADEGPFSVT